MEPQIIHYYKGERWVLHNIPHQKHHKAIEKVINSNRRWEWAMLNDWKIGIVVAVIVFIFTVWLGA